MHEYPLTTEIVRIAAAKAAESQAAKVTRITLVVGELSGFAFESIQMYFEIIAEGTVCAGAELAVTKVKARWHCPRCGELFQRQPLSFACPLCGTEGEPSEIGREFYVDKIEVE
jgi:hydrogenase nickel incorporation protein HypA/HybF